ncbi:MAG: tRNA (guanosine(37)-N1)-methyltransferase TrmD [Candidatus Sumerlaeaceae bacterium]
MKFDILTLFPEMFAPVVDASILKRGQAAGAIEVVVHNIRDFTTDKHHVTDDAPYGGGPGMVMKPEPIAGAVEAIRQSNPSSRPLCIYLSPQGEVWNQQLAEELVKHDSIILLCGHYEGIDERARELYVDREISIGDYVLTGGELPAMVLIDTMARLVPGVVGNEDSVRQDSFSAEGLLDHPHYTRPEEFGGMHVPEILLSGHHKNIQEWRRLQAIQRTLDRRPDLITRCFPSLSSAEQRLIESLIHKES